MNLTEMKFAVFIPPRDKNRAVKPSLKLNLIVHVTYYFKYKITI